MILFIDAYNLLRQLFSAAQIDQGAHKAVEREIAVFARENGHTVYMVYDGSSGQYGKDGFITIYSGYTQTADDVIKERIVAYPPEKTVLVSQDRELCAYVAHGGYHSIDPLDFYNFIQHADQERTVARKLTGPLVKFTHEAAPVRLRSGRAAVAGEDVDNLDALMYEASMEPFYKHGSETIENQSQKRKSKKEKKMHRIITKL